MTKENINSQLETIGANVFVSIEGVENIPAKIDTGADSSSLHAEKISVSEDGVLSFVIFGKKISTKNFKVAVVRSSNGDESIRYRTPLSLKLGSKTIKASFSLSDRSKNNFPVLIGRRTIKNKFIVDVSRSEIDSKKIPSTKVLNQELKKNPFKFHQKYIKSSQE